jgi:methionine S-methyltransferase
MGMATTSEAEVKDFLEQCKVSGDNAYNVIKGVLERLHNEDTRADARKLLAAVQKYVEKEEPGVESMAVYHFRLHQLSLTDYEGMVCCPYSVRFFFGSFQQKFWEFYCKSLMLEN